MKTSTRFDAIFNGEKLSLIANRTAKNYGTNRATEIVFRNDISESKVVFYDPPHAESRTGIRANLCVLRKFWSTYKYVSMECIVAIPYSFIQVEKSTREEF